MKSLVLLIVALVGLTALASDANAQILRRNRGCSTGSQGCNVGSSGSQGCNIAPALPAAVSVAPVAAPATAQAPNAAVQNLLNAAAGINQGAMIGNPVNLNMANNCQGNACDLSAHQPNHPAHSTIKLDKAAVASFCGVERVKMNKPAGRLDATIAAFAGK
jgi:hypothetical protein